MIRRFVLIAVMLFTLGCSSGGDQLSMGTLIRLSRLQGRLEGQLAVPCAKVPTPPWCVELRDAANVFDGIVENTIEHGKVKEEKMRRFLDILWGLAGKAAGI